MVHWLSLLLDFASDEVDENVASADTFPLISTTNIYNFIIVQGQRHVIKKQTNNEVSFAD